MLHIISYLQPNAKLFSKDYQKPKRTEALQLGKVKVQLPAGFLDGLPIRAKKSKRCSVIPRQVKQAKELQRKTKAIEHMLELLEDPQMLRLIEERQGLHAAVGVNQVDESQKIISQNELVIPLLLEL